MRGRGPAGDRLDGLVRAALAEDLGDGDRTTRWTLPEGRRGRARILAREEGVLAGREPAERVFRLLDPLVDVSWRLDDGDAVESGAEVAAVQGPLRAILGGERTALNYLARLSGIATLTRRFVDAVDGTGCRVMDTRKTTPGWRALEKAATAAGGAVNHRMGLWDMVLVKENHVRAAGSMASALESAVPRARREGVPVVVEVADLRQLERALAAAPDRILLDNMTLEELEEAVRTVRSRREPPPLEASGGISLETVREVALAGVDFVSVGAITHSAPALDLSLLVTDVETEAE